MPGAAALDEPLERMASVLYEQRAKLSAAATLLTLAGFALLPTLASLAAFAAGATLAALAAMGAGVRTVGSGLRRRTRRALETLAGDDPAPQVAASRDGALWFANEAALRRFAGAAEGSLLRALGEVFADPAGMLENLHRRALDAGFAREEVPTRQGEMILTVKHIGSAGFLWRFDELGGGLAAVSGGQAVGLPMLTAAPSGAILYMNEPLRRLIGRRVKHIDRILTDLPPRSADLQDVATAEGPRTFRLAVVPAEEGRSAIYFLPAEGEEQPAPGSGLEATTENLPVGLLSLRADGTIVGANRLARELIGASRREEPMGRLLSDWLEGLGRPVGDWLDEAMKGRGLGKPEVLRVRDTATETFVQVTLGSAGSRGPARLVAVLNDATELKTLQAQFVQSQKMQAIGQLAGGVAHDFNNLLTAISGHCDLMLLRHDQGDPDYADLVQIHQNANRAASLVGQLLAFSRKQTLQPQVIDLRDTLSDLTHLLNRLVGERIKLTLHHEASLPAIRADKRQLEQVLMNLVVNARDAMPEGGEIRIETMERVLADDLRRDRAKVPAGRYVVVKVEDHGSGIPEDKIGKIFEPFYTTKRQGEGTGLGLSTAYGIIKQSGGFIFVDSVVGSGTVFTLYFPAHDQRRAGAARDVTQPPRPTAAAARPPASAGARPAVRPAVRPAALHAAAVAEAAAEAQPGAQPAGGAAPPGGGGEDGTAVASGVATAAGTRARAGACPDAGSGEGSGDLPGDLSGDLPGGPAGGWTGGRSGLLPGGGAGSWTRSGSVPGIGAGAEGGLEAEIEPDGASAPETMPPMRLPPLDELLAAGPAGDDPAAGGGRSGSAGSVPPDAAARAPGPERDAAAGGGIGADGGDAATGGAPPGADAPDVPRPTAARIAMPTPPPPLSTPLPTPLPTLRPLPAAPAAARREPDCPDAVAAVPAGGSAAGRCNETEAVRAAPLGRVVLLVEDEAPVRAFASRALRMRGHVVIEAENAEEALSILEEPDLHVDLFVTDVIMPGMDGPTWVRRALERRPGVGVVFVSGYAEDSFGEEQARIPNSVFLPKPFSLGELTAVVQERLG